MDDQTIAIITGIGIGTIIGALISLVGNIIVIVNDRRIRKKERQFLFAKENYYKLREVAYEAIDAMNYFDKQVSLFDLDISYGKIVFGVQPNKDIEQIKYKLFNNIVIYLPSLEKSYTDCSKGFSDYSRSYFDLAKNVNTNHGSYKVTKEEIEKLNKLRGKYIQSKNKFTRSLQRYIKQKQREVSNEKSSHTR